MLRSSTGAECRILSLNIDDHLGMDLPISWRMMASGQFAYLALLLFILGRVANPGGDVRWKPGGER